MSVLVQLGRLPQDAMAMVQFMERFDKLFNAFNSSSQTSPHPMRSAIKEASPHHAFLADMLEWLQSVSTKGTRALPSMRGWRMAIRALQLLWNDLHDTHGLDYMLTNRLNQDCLENQFSVLRGKGGHGDNPTPSQFWIYLCQVMVDGMQVLSQSSNCEEDIDRFLLSLTAVRENSAVQQYSQPLSRTFPVMESDVNTELLWLISRPDSPSKDQALEVVEENVLTHIAGYIARKLRPKLCPSCQRQLTGELSGLPSETLLVGKMHENTKDGLVVPSTH